MQDRFKVRAWDKKNKKYIYDIQNGAEIYDYHSGHTDYVAYSELLESDNFIKEQCTELRDEYGKLIYEGDILETTDGSHLLGNVFYDSIFGVYMMNLLENNQGIALEQYVYLDTYTLKLKVVGNIHKIQSYWRKKK